ncbi:MAG: PAS domain S-box protein [Bacteroidia bacterium]|nr:PAS domain S-box protein [Bacteroidia bacterium]
MSVHKELWDNLPVGIAVLDEDRVAYANHKAHEILGIDPEYLESKEKHSIFDFILPGDQEKFLETYRSISSPNQNDHISDWPVTIRSGARRILQVAASRIHFGEHAAIQIVFSDVTDVRKNEERLGDIINNIEEVVYLIRAEGGRREVEFISENVNKLIGIPAEEYKRNIAILKDYVHPEDLPVVVEVAQRLYNNKTAQVQTYRFRNKTTGDYVWLEERVYPKLNSKGEMVAILGVTRDVTIRTLVEKQTRESERRYRELFENSVAGVFRTTVQGKMLDCNRAYLDIFECSREELARRGVASFYFRAEDREEYVRKLRKDGTVSNYPLLLKKTNGEGVHVLVNAKVLREPVDGTEVIEGSVIDITAFEKTAEALRESERTLSTLMNNLPGMAYRCLYDEYWTMLFLSNGCKELTGYDPEDIVGNKERTFSSLVHPEDKGIGGIQIRQSVRDKGSFEIEYRIIQAGGDVRWVWEKGEAVYGPDGEVLFLEGFIADVTERKLFELAQEDSRRMYKNLIESSPEGIFVHDLQGTILFTNQRALQLMGARSSDEFIGKNVLNFSLEEDLEILRRRKITLLRGEDHGYLESRVRNHKGDTIRIETKPILIDFQGEKAVLMFVRDPEYYRQLEKETLRAQFAEETSRRLQEEISERKNTERMLRETQKYSRLLIDSSIDMICASDREGKLTEFNAAAQKTFGYSADEVIGCHVSLLYANPEDRSTITEEGLYKSGTFSGEVMYRRKNGEIFHAYLSASVLKNDKGEIIGAMGVSRDITERKQNENRIIQSLHEKEVLLKEVHHRVKNNLQVISSILNLQSSYVKDKNTLMMLRESQDRIKSMAFIHESLYQTKDFSKVNFSEYVVNLSKNLMRSYDLSGRKVEFASQVENVHLNLDQSIPCGLIINELVSNALKYAFRKKKKGIITLKIREKDDKITVVLADDGDGIPEGFDYRNTDSLGLQLVVTLSEQLNGTIKLDRKNGTKFTITFPRMIKK